MRIIIAACIGVIIASLVLMVAQPFGGRVSMPSTYAQQSYIELANNLNPGDPLKAAQDLRVGRNYQYSPPSHYRNHGYSGYPGHISRNYVVPEGADSQLWMARYDGLIAAQQMHTGMNLGSGNFMLSTANLPQGNGQKTAIFAQDLKAGTILNPSMLAEVDMPLNSQLRGLYLSGDKVAEKLATAQGGRVLAVDVKQGMPAMPQLLIRYEDYPYKPAAPVIDKERIDRAAAALERAAPYSRWGSWHLVWADNLAPGTEIDIDQHITLKATFSINGDTALTVRNATDIAGALGNIAGYHTLYSTRKNTPVEPNKIGLQP